MSGSPCHTSSRSATSRCSLRSPNQVATSSRVGGWRFRFQPVARLATRVRKRLRHGSSRENRPSVRDSAFLITVSPHRFVRDGVFPPHIRPLQPQLATYWGRIVFNHQRHQEPRTLKLCPWSMARQYTLMLRHCSLWPSTVGSRPGGVGEGLGPQGLGPITSTRPVPPVDGWSARFTPAFPRPGMAGGSCSQGSNISRGWALARTVPRRTSPAYWPGLPAPSAALPR